MGATPRYRIKCWIPVEPDEEEIYSSIQEAKRNLKHYRFLHPENVYAIEQITEDNDKGLEAVV